MIDARSQVKPLCPVVNALQRALTVCLDVSSIAQSSRIGVFSYTNDFSELWNLEEGQSFRTFSDADFVIVINDGSNRISDLPEANKNLSALDWAVWLTLSCVKAGNNDQLCMPTIVILENDATKNTSSSDAERFWSLFSGRSVDVLPWITRVSSRGLDADPCCLLQLLQIIVGGKRAHPGGDLSMIRQVWQSFFLRPTLPSDNHALANLLGAGLLTGDVGESPTRQAIMKLMRMLDLLPEVKANKVRRACPKAISDIGTALHTGLPKKARHGLRLLLVDDDQERHDWATFVARSLGLSSMDASGWRGQIGKMQCRLTAVDRAAVLLDKIKASRKESSGLRFDLEHRIDVLFLDLRLFERTSLSVEANFFKDVIQELRSINNSNSVAPSDWPNVEGAELERLEDWCDFAIEGSGNATRDDEQYIESLTLLPRVMAIIDADLPVILFSSTQRRRVTELLKPYGNVITTFSKPPLQLGSSEHLVEETMAGLERAILAAMELVHARRLRRLLLDEQFPVYWKGHVEKPIDQKADEPWSVQLLIDESGERKLTVGGFLAVYPPGVVPSTVNDEIYRQRRGIREQTKVRRREELPTTLWEVVTILGTFGVLVVPISISGKRHETATARSSWKGSSSFEDETVEDNLHRELMRCLIELGLYVFARQILPEAAAVEFHFHAPTRQLPVTPPEAAALNQTWGIQSRDKFAKHFDHNCARPLVEEVAREYRRSIFEPQPVLARAYGLNTERPAEVAMVHALHYLADSWLSNSKHPKLAALREVAIKGNYDARFSRLLEAHRHLAHGEIATAIAIGAPVAISLSPTERSTAANSIVTALQDAARSMTGPECLSLSVALRSTNSAKENQDAIGIVCSVSGTDSSVEVEWRGKKFRADVPELLGTIKVGDLVQFVPRRGNRVGTFIARDLRPIAPIRSADDGM